MYWRASIPGARSLTAERSRCRIRASGWLGGPACRKRSFYGGVSTGYLVGGRDDALDERRDAAAPDGVFVLGEDDEFCEGVFDFSAVSPCRGSEGCGVKKNIRPGCD
jgi:hypothetical protein